MHGLWLHILYQSMQLFVSMTVLAVLKPSLVSELFFTSMCNTTFIYEVVNVLVTIIVCVFYEPIVNGSSDLV